MTEVITLAIWDDISTYLEAQREGLHAESAKLTVDEWDTEWRNQIAMLAERMAP